MGGLFEHTLCKLFTSVAAQAVTLAECTASIQPRDCMEISKDFSRYPFVLERGIQTDAHPLNQFVNVRFGTRLWRCHDHSITHRTHDQPVGKAVTATDHANFQRCIEGLVFGLVLHQFESANHAERLRRGDQDATDRGHR